MGFMYFLFTRMPRESDRQGLCCCVLCVTYFERSFTTLLVDSLK